MKPFTALEKLILFDSDAPYIAWVAQVTSVTFSRDDVQFVCVSRTETHAQAGEHREVRARHIQTYSDALWAKCQDWIERKRVLAEDFQKLHNGGI